MLVRIVSLLIANSLIVGCAYLPSQPPSDDTLEPSSLAATAPEPIITTDKPFQASTFYSLLVAEVAGQRQQFDVSLANYLSEAEKTQDPAIAERATRIAQYLGAHTYATKAAKIWVESAPRDAQAHQILAQAMMMEGDFSGALTHLETVFTLSGASQFDYLALNAQALGSVQKNELLTQFEALTLKYPDYPPLWMAKGALLLQLEHYSDALSDFNNALSLRENYTAAALNKARTLHKLNKPEEALEWLDDLHDAMPKHKGIGVLRARILIDLKRYSEARAAFQYLYQLFPDDASIQLSLGLLNIELLEFDEAIATLTPLTLSRPIADEAYFYLARIAELQEDLPRALRNLHQVQQGRQFLPAQLQIMRLLIDMEGIDAARDHLSKTRGQYPQFNTELVQLEIELLIKDNNYPEAYAVANMAIDDDPENVDLLYSRGLIAEKLNNIPQLEADLRKIIKLHPDNAEAMNALGYTLADKTDRFAEALALVQQALVLAPQNPAIIDSLGWIHYRLGDLNKALELLQLAYNDFPDHEVAAHLGEVLWQLNRPQEAEDIWRQGLEEKADSPVLMETLKRFNVESLLSESESFAE